LIRIVLRDGGSPRDHGCSNRISHHDSTHGTPPELGVNDA
jgi:hypothetical protein